MTLLMGVEHKEKNLEAVIRRLDCEVISGRKIMLETSSYPAISRVVLNPLVNPMAIMTADPIFVDIDPSFVKFWDGIAKYSLDHGGSLVFGEDVSFYQTQFQRLCELHRQILLEQALSYQESDRYDFKERRVLEREKQLQSQYDQIAIIERNEHFAKVIAEQRPDFVILGARHIPHLIENCFQDCNYSACFIPHEVNPYLKPNLAE